MNFSLTFETAPFFCVYPVYGPTFGNAESRLFLFSAQCFNIESMQKVFLCHSCVETATKITLITDGILFGSLRVKGLMNCVEATGRLKIRSLLMSSQYKIFNTMLLNCS
jgi:hypothetical protein